MKTIPQRAPARNKSRLHFDTLDVEQKTAAIYRLADQGFSEYDITAATGLSVEMVRQILGERASR